ncbi:MAG: hypothetical protein WBV94_04075 [Blastocatellia bacterium]
MDIALLAKDLVILLTPALPYLIKVSHETADTAAKEFVIDELNRASYLWSKLLPKLGTRPAALEAVQDIVATPTDEDALATL